METNIIKQACSELGITQKELAERLGVAEGSLKTAVYKGVVSNQMQKGIENILKIHRLEKKLEATSALKEAMKEILEIQ